MMIMNWHLHPKADILLPTWNNPTVTVNSDGTRTYYHASDSTLNPFSEMCGGSLTDAVCVVRFRELGSIDAGEFKLRDGTEDGIWAFKQSRDFINPYFRLRKALTPIALAIYTPEDWERLQSMGVTFFNGDTMPLA
ncbi:hypothetical protein [Bifidobacterium catenulatum]|nr:hypothetical protein [Bifidobacterium catenulatum]